MATKGESKPEKHLFGAVHNIILAGVRHPAGSTVELSADEFETLQEEGSVAYLNEPKAQEAAQEGPVDA